MDARAHHRSTTLYAKPAPVGVVNRFALLQGHRPQMGSNHFEPRTGWLGTVLEIVRAL